ncbi:hypothetical protein PFLmoz3_03832 [Pseudomonas fluorescens]|uniref:Uncharacterized protein n=1 Tax=Pseudomonas fluorescens TaxID=294 RepID=A0A120G6X5_PSEFL|nr:hypothetical protein PFLmoz3_03832 [Pseudomonas fluorescens]
MAAEAIGQVTRRYTGNRRDRWPDGHGQAHPGGIEAQATGQVERAHHKRGHDHRRHQNTHDQAGAQRRIAQGRPECIAWPNVAAVSIRRQITVGEGGSHTRQGQADQKQRAPAPQAEQYSADTRPHGRAECRHSAEQAHDSAGIRFRDGVTDHAQGHRHHDRRAQALECPCADQPGQGWRGGTPGAGQGKHQQPGQQQAPAPQTVAQAPGADNHGGDGQQVGEHHPLHGLKRCPEGVRQAGQADIRDAGAQGGQQHGQRQGHQAAACGGLHACFLE